MHFYRARISRISSTAGLCNWGFPVTSLCRASLRFVKGGGRTVQDSEDTFIFNVDPISNEGSTFEMTGVTSRVWGTLSTPTAAGRRADGSSARPGSRSPGPAQAPSAPASPGIPTGIWRGRSYPRNCDHIILYSFKHYNIKVIYHYIMLHYKIKIIYYITL